MRRERAVSSVFAVLVLLLANHTIAGIITVEKDLVFIDNRPTDDIFGRTGLNLNLTLKAVDTDGSSALSGGTVKAAPSNLGFPFSTPVNVPLNAVFPITGGAEFTRILPINVGQFSSLTGTYTYTVTDTTAASVNSTSHNLDKTEVIPIPINLGFSNLSTTPVFTFADPDPTPNIANLVRRYQVEIFDGITKTNIFQSAATLTAPSFAVPDLILDYGMTYYFRAVSWDFDVTETDFAVHSRGENRAIAYAIFGPVQAVPEPSTLVLLGSGLAGLAGLGRRRKRR